MAKILVNKNTLSSSVSSFGNDVRRLNTQLDNIKSCLNNISDHELLSVGSKAKSIATSFGNLRDNYSTEASNLRNYVTSITDIDDKDPMENVISISSMALKQSITDVNFDDINYTEKYKNPHNLSGYRLDFVNSLVEGAVQAYKKYGVLPSLTLAQAILESGWGVHSIGNNIFGIKAGSSWTGKRKNVKTSEQRSDGSYYQIYADFRDYDSVAESVEDHAKLLTNDRYKPVIAAKNYREACVKVRECGYATSLEYANNLINIIEMYGLNQWDK
jgi:flagellum-specific peptidoglycan hydrolase FlgJ